MHRVPPTAHHRVQQNRRRYDQAVDVVRRRADAGDLEGVLRSATVAANLAWWAPVGLLNDPELERMVVDTAGEGAAPASVRTDQRDDRVLHVLSEAYGTGGHTRLAWRWIERDTRRGDVALTNQQGDVPEALRAAVARSGGRLHDLRASAPALTDRTVQLRRLMDDADVVVLHVHPYDAVALAASALPGARPPVMVENHADHTFWLGLGAADVLSDYRDRNHQFSRVMRGVPVHRLGLLPLPIDEHPATPAPSDLRERLGVRDGDVLAVTVASEMKISPLWGRGLDGLLTDVLPGHPRLKVVLVGPQPHGRWAALAARHPGRVLAVGSVSDPEAFLAVADLYLNSYPVPSATSVLEAAASGLPVLSLYDMADDPRRPLPFHADSPGQEGTAHAALTEAQYTSQLRKLVRDPDLRAARGSAARSAVLRAHTGPGWSAALEALYRQAHTVGAADLAEYRAVAAVPDPEYAGMLVALAPAGDTTPELEQMAAPLGPQVDRRLSHDLFAASHRDGDAPVSVRIDAGWPDRPEHTRRLLALAACHPRLRVSVPPVPGDDQEATSSVAQLIELLADNGNDTTDCGDVNLEADRPRATGSTRTLTDTDDELDELEELLASPCWEPSGRPLPRP